MSDPKPVLFDAAEAARQADQWLARERPDIDPESLDGYVARGMYLALQRSRYIMQHETDPEIVLRAIGDFTTVGGTLLQTRKPR